MSTSRAGLAFTLALAPAVASGASWSVISPEEAEALDAQLDALWPGHEITIVVGETDVGFRYDGAALTWRRDDGGVMRQEVAFDPALLVVLARSWSNAFEGTSDGWIPGLPIADARTTTEPAWQWVNARHYMTDVGPAPQLAPLEPSVASESTATKADALLVEVGLGVVSSHSESEWTQAARLGARVHAGPATLETQMGIPAGSITQWVQSIALPARTSEDERVAPYLGSAGFATGIAPQFDMAGLTVGPAARAGVELRWLEDSDQPIDVAYLLGLGAEAWMGPFGARVCMEDHLMLGTKGGSRLNHDAGAAFDTMVRF